MNTKIFVSIFSLIVLAGCVSAPTKVLTAQSTSQLSGRSVTSTRYGKPDFVAMTAGKAMFAVIGAAAMVVAGNKIVSENGIEDPAISISAQLTNRLRQMGMMAHQNQSVASDDKVGALTSTYPGVDYLLDVKTINWSFSYYPTDWTHYRVNYSARVRLINTANGAIVGQFLCNSTQEDPQAPPTYDQLLANNAAQLKKYLEMAGNACVADAAKQVLGV